MFISCHRLIACLAPSLLSHYRQSICWDTKPSVCPCAVFAGWSLGLKYGRDAGLRCVHSHTIKTLLCQEHFWKRAWCLSGGPQLPFVSGVIRHGWLPWFIISLQVVKCRYVCNFYHSSFISSAQVFVWRGEKMPGPMFGYPGIQSVQRGKGKRGYMFTPFTSLWCAQQRASSRAKGLASVCLCGCKLHHKLGDLNAFHTVHGSFIIAQDFPPSLDGESIFE